MLGDVQRMRCAIRILGGGSSGDKVGLLTEVWHSLQTNPNQRQEMVTCSERR